MNRLLYSNFINSLRADETKKKYDFCIKDFMKFVNCDNDYSKLLKLKVEQKIIDYIVHLRKSISSATLNTRLAAVYHFYTMNDVILNKTKINKYKGEFRRVKKDRAYTNEEIHRVLDMADLRMKVCILLMASAGLRIGAVPLIKMKHLEKVDNNLFKITVYEMTNDEYYTFCTPECASFIDEYIKYRERNGEKMTPESYLIRDRFDDYDFKVNSRGVSKHTIREIIAKLLVKSGTRLVGQVALTHGFRKFFTTQLVKADVNVKTELRWMLEGHRLKANDPAYVKTTEKDLLEEYQKAIDNLTINEEFRLLKKVETLKIEKSQLELIAQDIAMLKRKMKKR